VLQSAVHLATGIAVRNERLLLVASRYANQPQPLWNLPGGRQQPGELLAETVVREFYEETHLRVRAGELAYVSESYDANRHFLNATFLVEVVAGSSFDGACPERSNVMRSAVEALGAATTPEEPPITLGEHVVAIEWVPLEVISERIAVRVVREPLLAYLEGRRERRYTGYHDAGITIEWPADSL
jgi:ADP-ribose pyrophosphatase YjhB (NUDIX family)